MRCLITGGSGFVGTHLVRYLENQEHEVFTFDQREGQDIRNYEQLRNAVDFIRPQRIYHLAALAYVPESFVSPYRAVDINIVGSLNLLEAVRQTGIKARILLAGTSEEYGDTPADDGPITENAMINPLSPYAITKATMDYFGRLYARSYGMDVVVTRAFNHAGPGRGEMYAESAFAKQIAEIERGERKVLLHGNLESIRNYTDARDMVVAYTKAIELESDVYNICSDNNVSMQEMMDILLANAKTDISTQINKSLYRPVDFSFKKPSCQKFKNLTGWEATISLEKTLVDILEDWRERLI